MLADTSSEGPESSASKLMRLVMNPARLAEAVSWRVSAFLTSGREYIHQGGLRLFWYNEHPNLGDEISSLIVEKVAGIKVRHSMPFERKKLLAVGSVIHYARGGDLVWGAGAIEPGIRFKERDFTVTAVRGPKTREVLKRQGVECPEVYGDPAILTPEFYPALALSAPKYRLGIIPHYIDRDLFAEWRDPAVRIIDITAGRDAVFSDLWQCERIVSSSLHGIIFAESYGIPAHWMVLSSGIRGADFKFHDYYLGTDREPPLPLALGNLKGEQDWVAPRYGKEALLRAFPRDVIARPA